MAVPGISPIQLALDEASEHLIRVVDPRDTMSNKSDDNNKGYFAVGRSAAQCVLASMGAAGVNSPRSVLDFGCGWGRVTRWLKALYPNATVYACDIDLNGLTFIKENIEVDTFVSNIDIEKVNLRNDYDLIFVGSVVTHLSEELSDKLMKFLFSSLSVKGIMVLSSHGKHVAERVDLGVHKGKPAEVPYMSAVRGYHASGYGYADYSHIKNYGISVIHPSWFADWSHREASARLVGYVESGWNKHQDVISIQKVNRQDFALG